MRTALVRRWLVVPAAAAALVLVTGVALVILGVVQRGVTYGLDGLDDLRLADAPGIGANTFLHQEPDPGKVVRELEVLRGAGIGIIRQEFQWIEIEPLAKGSFVDAAGRSTWDKYDRIVDAAGTLGIEILARLDRPPAWATPGFDPTANPSIQTPPSDLDDFADFAAAVAERYAGQVRFFQIWNEPNLIGEWGGRPPDPAAYLEMLRRVGGRIRQANPAAAVVLAGLAPTIETGPENLSDLLFLRRLYELGARGDFDVASSMSYGLFTGPRDFLVDPLRTNFPRAMLWREVMEEFGDIRTPIWASEYGWMALPDDWDGEPGIWGNHSIDDQAAWTVDGIHRAREEWPWMPTIMIWASRWPVDAHPRDPTPFFRLMDKDFTPRPNLVALRRAFATAPVAGVGLHQETHPALAFEGPWPRVPSDDASLGFHRQTGVVGATVRLRFQGSELALLTRRGPDMGRLRVRIDGQDALPDLLERNSAGEALLDLYAPEPLTLVRVPIASRLPDGRHLVELTVIAERNPSATGALVIVDGLLVGVSRPVAPYVGLIALWLAGLGAAFWALAPLFRRVASPFAVGWGLLDRELRWGLRAGELAVAVLATLYLVLPGGGPTSVWTIVRIVIVAVVAGLALARPRQVVVVTVAAVPFVGVIARTGVFDRPVAEALILVLAGAWVVRALWYRRVEIPRTGWNALLAYFLVAAVAAALFADFQKFALRDLRTVIIEPLILFVVIVTTAGGRADVPRILRALVLGAAVSAIVALILIPAGAVVTDAAVPRIRGLFGSPNNLALVLERALPLAFGFALMAARDRERRLAWTAFTIVAVGLVLTFSRGAWVGALLGISVAALPLWLVLPRITRAVSLVTVGLAAALIALTAGFDRLGAVFRAGDAGGERRLAVWDAAWRMIQDNWVFGVGPDNFLHHYRAYLRPDAWREPNLSHPHNLVLDAWVSVGIFGLIALAVIVALFWIDWLRVARRVPAPERPLAYGLAGAMVAALAHGVVDHSFFLPELAAVFWVLAAAVYLLRAFPSEPPPSDLAPPTVLPASDPSAGHYAI